MRGSVGADAGEPGRDGMLISGLAEYLESCGGEPGMVDGWYTRTEVRLRWDADSLCCSCVALADSY